MTERQMEDLIAQFPEEFFRGYGFVLKGRQQSFAGIGRFDLLFLDSFQTNILMELKAVTAKYEDASQLAKYKEALQQRNETNILMWLVAPQIPTSVREFLDRIGIEYSEIHEVHFRRVALRHGIDLVPDSPVALASAAARQRTASSPSRVMSPRTSQADCPYALKSDFDKAELDKLLKSFESVIKRQRDRSISQRLRHELLDADPPSVSFGAIQQLAKWCNSNNPVYWDGMDVARKISQLLFGCVLDRSKLGV